MCDVGSSHDNKPTTPSILEATSLSLKKKERKKRNAPIMSPKGNSEFLSYLPAFLWTDYSNSVKCVTVLCLYATCSQNIV